MKKITILFAVMLLGSCVTAPQPEMKSSHSHKDPKQIKRKLAAIDLGEVSFRPEPLPHVLAFWMGRTLEQDPQHTGVSAVFPGSHSTTPLLDDPFENLAYLTNSPMVSIQARHISSLEFLNETCRQANLIWYITPKCIMIISREDFESNNTSHLTGDPRRATGR